MIEGSFSYGYFRTWASEKPFVLSFDHRSSFERGLLGTSGRQPSDDYEEGVASCADAVSRIAGTHQGLHELFLEARANAASVLVFGSAATKSCQRRIGMDGDNA